eukprot:m51a1_g2204 putative splicing factor 3b subunit 3-like (1210) ;mRNA; r:168623-173209
MYLYALTLQKPSAINCCVYGNFSGPASHELVVARGHVLELLRPDDSARLRPVCTVDVFGVVRSLATFRLPGWTRDVVVVGSDSGMVAILELDAARQRFQRLHLEVFGKSGCRRIVPGEYLASDPRGRAVMIAAVEKQKLVYVLNRDAKSNLTISSPLEAHKAHTVLFGLCGVDVGFDNPIFAALEFDYADFHSPDAECAKALTFYELDLGLNHVSRKWTDSVDNTANLVLTVPGAQDGPGGVLVCAANCIYWKNSGRQTRMALLPRRKDMLLDDELIITAAALHRQKNMFFFVLQSELGDAYKVTLEYTGAQVDKVVCHYFDTLPVANSIAILRNGYMFVASEFGNHHYYRFVALGSPTDDTYVEIDAPAAAEDEEPRHFVLFDPRPLKNLTLVDELESLAPLLDLHVLNPLREDAPQLTCLCGRGPRSTFRAIRRGVPVTELATSQLPYDPMAIFTTRRTSADEYDRYIVVSFATATLVLAVGDTVQEVGDSGLLTTSPTLAVGLLGADSLLQVHTAGVRIVRPDGRVHEWVPPGKRQVVCASSNGQQVALALSGPEGELFYFELEPSTGQLTEVERHEVGREVRCVDVAPCARGQRARFLAAADDISVRVFSLTPDARLVPVATQVVPTPPSSVALCELEARSDARPVPDLYLTIGLSNGVMLRAAVDTVTGELSDTRMRFLGARPARLFRTRSWVCYQDSGRFCLVPLSVAQPPPDHAAHFSSELCPEGGFIALSGRFLRVLAPDARRLAGGDADAFSQVVAPLRRTPRRSVTLRMGTLLAVLESDHNSSLQAPQPMGGAKSGDDDMAIDDGADSGKPAQAKQQGPLDERVFGAPRPGTGQWASLVRLVDASDGRTLDTVELGENEAAFSICLAPFDGSAGADQYIVVGTAKDLVLHPRQCLCGFLHVYKLVDGTAQGADGSAVPTVRLQLVHKTRTEDLPMAVSAFQEKLLAGIGNTLRLYDLGKKQLLRKCERRGVGNCIAVLQAVGDRIVLGDISESLTLVKYRRSENRLVPFADDTVPRWLTTVLNLDHDTWATADKFGTIAISRVPQQLNDDIDEDIVAATGGGYLCGAPYRLQLVNHFYTGDTVTAMTRAALSPGGAEAIVYGTTCGAIGALLPFDNREDVDFFQHLEMHMRAENPPLLGRDHMAYRSYYFPVKDVIDGDLCEQFATLDEERQQGIAQELERTPAEVMKKLEDLRHNRLL